MNFSLKNTQRWLTNNQILSLDTHLLVSALAAFVLFVFEFFVCMSVLENCSSYLRFVNKTNNWLI